jgi:hypothetical protein
VFVFLSHALVPLVAQAHLDDLASALHYFPSYLASFISRKKLSVAMFLRAWSLVWAVLCTSSAAHTALSPSCVPKDTWNRPQLFSLSKTMQHLQLSLMNELSGLSLSCLITWKMFPHMR